MLDLVLRLSRPQCLGEELFLSKNAAVSGVLRYRASGPSPSRSRKPSATSASRKSSVARGWRPRERSSSFAVRASEPSWEKRLSSLAESSTLVGQKPIPTSRIRVGERGSMND